MVLFSDEPVFNGPHEASVSSKGMNPKSGASVSAFLTCIVYAFCAERLVPFWTYVMNL